MGVLERAHGAIGFGHSMVLRDRRELLVDGKTADLSARAFEVLMVLLEAGGALVSKRELMGRVWPGLMVEENTLQSHVHGLRKALGEDRTLILTESGRGYRFIGEMTTCVAEKSVLGRPVFAAHATSFRAATSTNLPTIISDLIGREMERDEVRNLARAHRMVTLTGIGGVGKTRLGIEAARQLLPGYADGIWLVEFEALSDPDLVPLAIASALGLDIDAPRMSVGHVAAALAGKSLMLLLDCCEHLVEAISRVAETLLHRVEGIRVLATSREPLGVEGERNYPVPPLGVPPADASGAKEALYYGAVQLFVARAWTSSLRLSLDDAGAAAVAAICRRLDGIPLAIELAATHAATVGLDGLATRLGDRLCSLAGAHRTAHPRHQTLRANFDWSHALLAETGRVLLRRLAVFAGEFTLEAAQAVASGDHLAESIVIDQVTDLVAKSCVVANVGVKSTRYRLLETIRDYALEQLIDSGEYEAIARRHATYCLAIG